MVSEFKVLFSFFFFCFKFLARGFHRLGIIFFALPVVYILFSAAVKTILKHSALRNLTFFVKFLPLLEKKSLPRLTHIKLGEFFCFLQKKKNLGLS